MIGYLGEFEVKIEDTPFAKYTNADWAMHFLEAYGQIDGSHHKTWVLDQIARIMKGTPVILVLAKWESGVEEYRYWTAENPSQEYLDWVVEMKGAWIESEDYTGFEYDYDEGIAP